MKEDMKRTKIICTIGPASESKEMLASLMETGMNICRLNFSHGDYEEHGNRIDNIREVGDKLGKNIAILLDTKGPEVRCGDFKNGSETYEKGNEASGINCEERMLFSSEFFYLRISNFYFFF